MSGAEIATSLSADELEGLEGTTTRTSRPLLVYTVVRKRDYN